MKFYKQEVFGKHYGVYQIQNTINKKVYVGQTRENFSRRFWLHNHLLRHNKHDNWNLQEDYNKYGTDAFEFRILEAHFRDDVDGINEGERVWINHYKNLGLAYNILDGGPGAPGVHLSEETKRKIGEKNRIHMTGRKASEETKQKMSKSRKGKRHDSILVNDPEDARKIKELLIKGLSAPEVAETLNVPYKLVNSILSSNSWSTVHVDGWDEFLAIRQKKYKRMTKAEYEQLMQDYADGVTVKELCKKYNKEIHTVRNLVTKRYIPKTLK